MMNRAQYIVNQLLEADWHSDSEKQVLRQRPARPRGAKATLQSMRRRPEGVGYGQDDTTFRENIGGEMVPTRIPTYRANMPLPKPKGYMNYLMIP